MSTRPSLVEVTPLPRYRLRLRYDDGVEGEVDLSHLVGVGVFSAWEQAGFFERVRIASHGGVAWGEDIDLCPDALYLRLTGKSADICSPGSRTGRLPEISRFYGIVIQMYYDDHNPPHFHAIYGGHSAIVEIAT